jgi:hypothetical protein
MQIVDVSPEPLIWHEHVLGILHEIPLGDIHTNTPKAFVSWLFSSNVRESHSDLYTRLKKIHHTGLSG